MSSDLPRIARKAPAGPGPIPEDAATEVELTTERRLAVFGGGSGVFPDTLRDTVEKLGSLLALDGFAILQGGYGGLMEVIARGAAKEKGRVYAVTAEVRAEEYRNPYVLEEFRHLDLFRRNRYLIETADAFLVLPGGLGTMSELTNAWSHLKSLPNEETPPPLLVWAEPWARVLGEWAKTPGVWTPDLETMTFVKDPEEVLARLEETVPIGGALTRYEARDLPWGLRAQRYLGSAGQLVRPYLADLSPSILRGLTPETGSLRPVLAYLEATHHFDPGAFTSLRESPWRAEFEGNCESFVTEFQPPRRGKLRVRQVSREKIDPRSQVVLKQVHTEVDNQEGRRVFVEDVLRIMDSGATWVLVLDLSEGNQAAVAARSARERRRLTEGIRWARWVEEDLESEPDSSEP